MAREEAREIARGWEELYKPTTIFPGRVRLRARAQDAVAPPGCRVGEWACDLRSCPIAFASPVDPQHVAIVSAVMAHDRCFRANHLI